MQPTAISVAFMRETCRSRSCVRGAQLSVTVVPDSGTGQLVGLSGQMAIKIDDGKHSYNFEYTLPETH